MVIKFRVQCPACKSFYHCKIATTGDIKADDGCSTIVMRPEPCKHLFLVFLDSKMEVRATQAIRDVTVESTLMHSSLNALLRKEKELIEKHRAAIDSKNDGQIEAAWQELKSVRKEIAAFGID
ncbi:MAG: hypothetical protein Q6373_004830 [Candidatus Sigynarchaeota archaeon]